VTTKTKGLDSPLKWHGGKSYLASRIVALFPEHTHYVEPYFGGGSVLLSRNPEGVSEVVNDLNGGLTNFWKVLRDEGDFERFRRLVEATPFNESDFVESEVMLEFPPADKVMWAWAFFVACRQSLAGRMDSFAPLSRTRTRRGMNEQASAWLTAVEWLPAVHARLKRVVILNHDAIDVIRQQDGPSTLFYLDPPYLHETRVSKDTYEHEMSPEQHVALLTALTELKGKFILSGYRSATYDAFADAWGWKRVDFDLANNAAGGATKRRMTECLWMNYESHARPGA
jgi:DNA adenine methylase